MKLNLDKLKELNDMNDEEMNQLMLGSGKGFTGASTPRMNHEIIRILTELPLILNKKKKNKKEKKKRHKMDKVNVNNQNGLSFRENTISNKLKEKEEMKYEHPNNVIVQSKQMEMSETEKQLIKTSKIVHNIKPFKYSLNPYQSEQVAQYELPQDDIKEFKMWIYGMDWQDFMDF